MRLSVEDVQLEARGTHYVKIAVERLDYCVAAQSEAGLLLKGASLNRLD